MPWAKAGIIIKENTTQGSTYAAVMVTPGHGVRMQYNYVHDTAGLLGTVSASSPRWLRLTRAGDLITGYDSLDGTHWTKIGTVHLAGLPDSVQAGLFVTSPAEDVGTNCSGFCTDRVRATLATATLDRVHLSGDFPEQQLDQPGSRGQHRRPTSPSPPGRAGSSSPTGTFTISGSGDIAPQVAGGSLGGSGGTTSLLAGGAFGLIARHRARDLVHHLRIPPRPHPHHPDCKPPPGPSPRRQSSCDRLGHLRRRLHRHRHRRSGLTARVVRQRATTCSPSALPPSYESSLGTGLLFAVAAVLVLALATLLRRSAGAVVAGIVVFVLPFILMHSLSPAAADWLLRFTPVAAFAVQGTLPRFAQVASAYTMQNGYYPLGPWVGLAVLGGLRRGRLWSGHVVDPAARRVNPAHSPGDVGHA